MLDVGAYVGLFSLVASTAVGPAGQVHSFEPVAGNFDRLEQNVQLNRVANIHLNRMAIGDRIGEVTLAIDAGMARTSGRSNSGCFTMSRVENPVRQETAPLRTIDSYYSNELGRRHVRLIKIDIEGAEPDALNGMRSVLAAHKVDLLLLEVNQYSLSRNGSAILDVIAPLVQADYVFYRLGIGGMLWPWKYRREPAAPTRKTWSTSMIGGLYQGMQDFTRLFNLVAIRRDLPELDPKAPCVTTGSLSPRLPAAQ